jgi:alpha-ribazole phosphatase CobZ
MAAIRLNEDGASGLIPNMPEATYNSDPVHLVADEMIGTLISMQIAGYYGLFEFYRFDRKKPGILGVLPPFLDDALGALIAGVSSKMYSEVIKRHRE